MNFIEAQLEKAFIELLSKEKKLYLKLITQ